MFLKGLATPWWCHLHLTLRSSIEEQRITSSVWIFSLYSDDKIYMEHMWQYTLREKRLKSLVLLVLWVKGGCLPTLDLWVWGLSYLLIMTPLVDFWSFIFYLVLALLLCVPLVWWLLFYSFYFVTPFNHWYPILSQLLFYGFYFVRPFNHWYHIVTSLNFILCFWLVKLLKARSSWVIFLEGLSRL